MTSRPTIDPGSQIGRLIADRYRLIALIGAGGMGQVFQARHLTTGGLVAVKLLHASLIRDKLAISRFRQEACNAAALDHPNTIRVIDYGLDGDTPFLVLEHLNGRSLERVLEASGPMPWPRTVHILVQILRGLQAAHGHELQIVHSDIKTSNILLIEAAGMEDFVKVLDFGISYALEGSGTFSHTMLGSPHTMAPEQWHGQRQTPATDLYAVGCVAFEMLAGHPPFDAPVPMAVALKHCGEPPRVAERLGDAAPPWLAEWIEAMLAKTPEARPLDARDALARLEHALGADGPATLHSIAETIPTTTEARTILLSASQQLPHHNLPSERGSFIGRRETLDTLAIHLDEGARLITLLGPGGVGKSRLATHFATRQLHRWPGGAHWCDLSLATNPESVLEAVATGLELQLGDEDPNERIAQVLASREASLLILDNAEQVYADLASQVRAWLDLVPTVTFLVTSRHKLDLDDEHLLPIDPLPIPDPLDDDPGRLGAVPAVELFVQRAATARGDIPLDPAEASTVAAIVRQLDGLPLAIELAAARCRTTTVHHILTGLDRRFALLRTHDPARPDRHAALAATIAWSWELLDEGERTALAQCSVFRAGFSAEAAEQVLDLPLVDGAPPFVLDVLESLVDHSLLRVRYEARAPRFDLLTSIAAFAAERLQERHEEHATRLRHAHCFARLAADAVPALGIVLATPEDVQPLTPEILNLERAARTAVEHALPEIAGQTLAALASHALVRGPIAPTRALVEVALDRLELPPTTRTTLELVRARLAFAAGDGESGREHARLALGNAMRRRDERLCGWSLELLARIEHFDRDYDEALTHLRTARTCALGAHDRALEATVDYLSGSIAHSLGQRDERVARWQRAAAIAHEIGDRSFEAMIRHSLAYEALYSGTIQQARDHVTACIAVAEQARDLDSLSWYLHTAATIDDIDGLTDACLEAHRRAVDLSIRVGRPYNQARFRHAYGRALGHAGRLDDAVEQLQLALDLAPQAGPTLAIMILGTFGEVRLERGELALALNLGREALQRANASAGDRRAASTALVALAAALLAAHELDEAGQHIDEALEHLEANGPPTLTARALILQARLHRARRDDEGATQRLARARAMIDALGAGKNAPIRREWELAVRGSAGA